MNALKEEGIDARIFFGQNDGILMSVEYAVKVGGGSILMPLKGASEVIHANHSGVANAIGAAIAQVSGQIVKVFVLDEMGRDQAMELAKSHARDQAIQAGADADSIVIVDIEDVSLAYMPGNATRICVKAAGQLQGTLTQ